MELKKLLQGVEIEKIIGNIDKVEIENLVDNSNKQSINNLFVCIKGIRVDAHSFYMQATKNGAVALVTERQLDTQLPQIVVKNTRVALGVLANNFFNKPLDNLKLISIVGTNGKTTTSYLIKNILENAELKVGVIGTSGNYIAGEFRKAKFTTPDTLELFSLFSQMQKSDVKVVVMELSAHAIKLNKTSGYKSDVMVFTNFSQDHLDFFETMEHYKQTKKSVFNNNFAKYAVINSDDKVGIELIKENNIKMLTYGIENVSDVFAINLEMDLLGSSYVINLLDEVKKVDFNLPAKFNIYNSLAAATACVAVGVEQNIVIEGLNKEHNVDGRFNLISVGKNCYVVIDYAHTPKALENLLASIKSLSEASIITVLGCPGNRDQTKRKIMGEIAGRFSDEVVITDDNCDLENPHIIMSQIKEGINKSVEVAVIENRQQAIYYAMGKLKPNSVLVIAGKGSETYQIINNIKSPYNDKDTVLSFINENFVEKG